MKVRVTKSFDWAPDGNHARTVAVGEVLEGRGAEVATELGCCEQLERGAPLPAPAPVPAEASEQPAPPPPPTEPVPSPSPGPQKRRR